MYWLDLGIPYGSEPGYRRPCIVVQNDAANRSAIHTVLVCATTKNLRLAEVAGNVLVKAGEGGLPLDSVAVVTAIVTIDKTRLDDYLGTLTRTRCDQIVAGIRRVIEHRQPRS